MFCENSLLKCTFVQLKLQLKLHFSCPEPKSCECTECEHIQILCAVLRSETLLMRTQSAKQYFHGIND